MEFDEVHQIWDPDRGRVLLEAVISRIVSIPLRDGAGINSACAIDPGLPKLGVGPDVATYRILSRGSGRLCNNGQILVLLHDFYDAGLVYTA